MVKKDDYANLTQELDTILDSLQGEDLQIDDAVKKYERGMVIVEQLQMQLKDAENKVTKIKADWDSKSST